MRFEELVANVAAAHNMSKKEAREVVRVVFQQVKSATKEGRETRVPGFGTFYRRVSKTRKVHLPGGGEKVIPETRSIRFRPAASSKFVVA